MKDTEKTKTGVITRIYNSQKGNSRLRGSELPEYSKAEFKDWMLNHPKYEELYVNWVNSDYDKNHKPSVDRIDDYKPYTLDNIQLMTWQENKDKCYKDRKEGTNIKNSKAVLQHTKEGEFVASYYSATEAARHTDAQQSHISAMCNGNPKFKSVRGFVWSYK